MSSFVELFCGFGTITDSFKKRGFKTWKTDIRKRRGCCEPDLRINILQLSSSNIPINKIDLFSQTLRN